MARNEEGTVCKIGNLCRIGALTCRVPFTLFKDRLQLPRVQGSRFMSPCFVFLLNVRIIKSCNSEHQDSYLPESFIAWVMVSDEASLGRTLRLVTIQQRYNYLSVYGEKRVVYDCLSSGTAECGNASWSKSSKSPELEFHDS